MFLCGPLEDIIQSVVWQRDPADHSPGQSGRATQQIMEYRIVTKGDIEGWLDLACLLWPEHTREALGGTLGDILISEKEDGVLTWTEQEQPVAFMNLSLRADYVPGANTLPVAYVEGIYVIEEFRNSGIARGLIEFAEAWAIDHGCSQLASDALLDNTESQIFHASVGFSEVERTVAFIKTIRMRGHLL